MSNPRIQLRHDTAANWSTANPVLLDGEVGIEKGGTTIPNFDNLSGTSYTLNGTVMSDFNVTQRDIGLSQLASNSTILTLQARVKIPTTAQNEWNNIYWLGRDGADNMIGSLVLLYDNGWTLRLISSGGGNLHNTEGSVPSEMLNEWVDIKATLFWDGYIIYKYIGMKLTSAENYTKISDYNHNNANTVGACMEPSWFFCKSDDEHSWDIFGGEADLAECSITYGDKVLWTGLTTSSTKLKIGDGETTWNDLPYIV